MPNYFRPKLKSNPELGVKEQFLAIDIELCKMLGVEPHPVNWVNQWVDTIGFCFAMGDTPDKIKGQYAIGSDMHDIDPVYAANSVKIIDWLVENCDIDCYASRVKE